MHREIAGDPRASHRYVMGTSVEAYAKGKWVPALGNGSRVVADDTLHSGAF